MKSTKILTVTISRYVRLGVNSVSEYSSITAGSALRRWTNTRALLVIIVAAAVCPHLGAKSRPPSVGWRHFDECALVLIARTITLCVTNLLNVTISQNGQQTC